MIDYEALSSEKGINEQLLAMFHSIRMKRQQRKLRDNRLKEKKKKKRWYLTQCWVQPWQFLPQDIMAAKVEMSSKWLDKLRERIWNAKISSVSEGVPDPQTAGGHTTTPAKPTADAIFRLCRAFTVRQVGRKTMALICCCPNFFSCLSFYAVQTYSQATSTSSSFTVSFLS